MRVLGIDPGVATTGWSVIDFEGREVSLIVDYGVIETSKELRAGERLLEIHTDLSKIVKKFAPDMAGVESLLFCNNSKTAMSVGEARGVVLLILEEYRIDAYSFTPLQIKSSVSGYGKAGKKQVQENVKILCNLDTIPKPDDAADAIAVAICCNDSLISNLSLKSK